MATAAYESLVSFLNTLTRFQLPTCRVSFDQSQVASLSHRVSSLVDLLEVYPGRTSNDLLRKMADVAFAAEDKIESYYVVQVIQKSGGCNSNGYDDDLLFQDMKEAICRMDLILLQAMEVKDHDVKAVVELKEISRHVGPGVLASTGMVNMVGLDEELLHLMDQLTSSNSSLQILPVAGMGGIGKTTLARNTFEHPVVKDHFQFRAWVTISQDYTVEKIILPLLSDIGVSIKESDSEDDLKEKLYKHLYGRKYLIVLDDMWDDLAWSAISRFFPDSGIGSRILFTTRSLSVARGVGSCSPRELKLLDDKKSRDYFVNLSSGKPKKISPSN